MTLVYIAIGVAIGTFIPMPQQQIVRTLVRKGWDWITGKAALKL